MPFVERAESCAEHLVEAVGHAEALRVLVDERSAVGDDRVIDGVPVAAQLLGDLSRASSRLTDLLVTQCHDPPILGKGGK